MKRIKSKKSRNRQLASCILRIHSLYNAYWTKIALNHVIPEYDMTPVLIRYNLKRVKSVKHRIYAKLSQMGASCHINYDRFDF